MSRRGYLAEQRREREDHLQQGELKLEDVKPKKETHKTARLFIEDYNELDKIKRKNLKMKTMADVVQELVRFYKQNNK